MLNGDEETEKCIKIRATKRKEQEMVRYYVHKPLSVDIRLSALSCPCCFDDDGVGQSSVCDGVDIGVNDGFSECCVSKGGGTGEVDGDGEDVEDDGAGEGVEDDGVGEDGGNGEETGDNSLHLTS